MIFNDRNKERIKVILKIHRCAITFFYCFLKGLKYDRTWQFFGNPKILRPYFFYKNSKTNLSIGTNLTLRSGFGTNSIGLIQPVLINARSNDCKIIIGNNVGISGSTICALKLIQIGNNVVIGSGCLLIDNDAHNIDPQKRSMPLDESYIKPIIIDDDVFIGARSIILKGVKIGKGAVIGAGSVVSRNVPDYTIFAGNPAKFIANIYSKKDEL